MMSMAAATVNAPAMNRPSSLLGDQCRRRCYFRRQVRRSLLQLRCACSSRLPCFPVALEKSESRETSAASSAGDDNDDSAFSLLTAVTSRYNEIVVLDTPKARFLLLDSSHNIHSILYKEQKWTGSYWDEFASLPAIVPQGPIAILGLGAGTAARLMLDLWPSCHIKGWEIDEILINVAREYFSLSDLESCTQAGGSLSIHIGDAFSPAAVVEGGFAGIVVDLFSEGKILPRLSEIATWLEIEKKLMPHGRIMVNCGGAHTELHAEIADSGYIKLNESNSSKGYRVQNSTIKAMCRAFPGKIRYTQSCTTTIALFFGPNQILAPLLGDGKGMAKHFLLSSLQRRTHDHGIGTWQQKFKKVQEKSEKQIPSSVKAPKVELKFLPKGLKHAFLGPVKLEENGKRSQ